MMSLETSLEFTLPPSEAILRSEVEIDRLSREFEREWRRNTTRPLVANWLSKCSEVNRAELPVRPSRLSFAPRTPPPPIDSRPRLTRRDPIPCMPPGTRYEMRP